uniref:Uncharacterized protein n=1 Tax=Myoviridae sp. ctkfK18 TaxID=2825165 RepID=A0A8S5VHF7_9CAUD|nr:MAG TPA: hypothetical protein [Myoviridae sp. ctkfK18]
MIMNKIKKSHFELIVINDALGIYYFNGDTKRPLLYRNFDRCDYTSVEDLLNKVANNRATTLLSELFKYEVGNNKRNLTKFLELISTPSEGENEEYDNFAFIMPTKSNLKFDVESVYERIDDSNISISFNFINDIFNFNFEVKEIHKTVYEDEDTLFKIFTEEDSVKYMKSHIESSLSRLLMIDDITDNYLDYLLHHIYENLKVFIRLNPSINTVLKIRLPDTIGMNNKITKE